MKINGYHLAVSLLVFLTLITNILEYYIKGDSTTLEVISFCEVALFIIFMGLAFKDQKRR